MEIPLNQLNTAIWIYDIDHSKIIWANNSALKLWDSSSVYSLQQRDLKSGLSTAVKEALQQYQQAFKQNKLFQEKWGFTPNGKEIEAYCQFSGYRLSDGRMGMLVEATPQDLHHGTNQFNSTTIISNYTNNGKFLSANPTFTKIFGASVTHLQTLICDAKILNKIFLNLKSNFTLEIDALMNTVQGKSWYHLTAVSSQQENSKPNILLHLYDIHDRKMTELALTKQARTDPLTGLLNRRGLLDSLTTSTNSNTPFTLLYIDLDGFKMINDSSGHGVGDIILTEVADRLSKTISDNSLLCRFGGDEFVAALYEQLSDQKLSSLLNQIIEAISEPYHDKQENQIMLSASIGSSHFPDDGKDIEVLLKCADAAMYQAKALGKKRWVSYKTGMENKLKRLSDLAQKLSLAKRNNELSLHYQPIIDITTNKIVSFEALLRWQNSELGYVNPQEVIDVAEKTGLIHEIENWVLNQALTDLLIFKKLIGEEINMAVNISGLHLSEPNLCSYIMSLLEKHKLKPTDLTIELTESVLLTDIDSNESNISQLINYGIKLNIDDFGTGYSSLAYLHAIRASVVKVDKSFLNQPKNNTVTLECIQTLISSLNMKSLIEGIETEYQAKLLQSLGFKLQQGYFHGKPKPLEYYLP